MKIYEAHTLNSNDIYATAFFYAEVDFVSQFAFHAY